MKTILSTISIAFVPISYSLFHYLLKLIPDLALKKFKKCFATSLALRYPHSWSKYGFFVKKK